MRSPGIVSIRFNYASPPYLGVPVDELTATVLDSNGRTHSTFVFSPSSLLEEISGSGDYQAYYQITDFDASDTTRFRGSSLVVNWQVTQGTESPSFTTTHSFVPVAPKRRNSRALSWSASSAERLAGYYIESKTETDASFSFLGSTELTTFLDETQYPAPYWTHGIQYQVYDLVWGPSPASPGPVLGDVTSPSYVTWLAPCCLVKGQINQINGTVEEVDYIRFYVDHKAQLPMVVSDVAYLVDRELTAAVDVNGAFGVCLPRGLVVTAEIPQIGMVKRFVVPDTNVVDLNQIDGTIFETYRAP